MGSREDRIVRNEALFRDLNERLREISASLSPGDEPGVLEIFCECGKPDCMDKLRVRLDAYETVRERPERFFVAEGHDTPDVEDVVERASAYWVVEKHEPEAQIARAMDPRSS